MVGALSVPGGAAAQASGACRIGGSAGHVAAYSIGVCFPSARCGFRWLWWSRHRSSSYVASASVTKASIAGSVECDYCESEMASVLCLTEALGGCKSETCQFLVLRMLDWKRGLAKLDCANCKAGGYAWSMPCNL